MNNCYALLEFLFKYNLNKLIGIPVFREFLIHVLISTIENPLSKFLILTEAMQTPAQDKIYNQ